MLNDEINKRLKNDNWDRAIARTVCQKIHRKQQIKIGAIMSLAMLLLVCTLFFQPNWSNIQSLAYSLMGYPNETEIVDSLLQEMRMTPDFDYWSSNLSLTLRP